MNTKINFCSEFKKSQFNQLLRGSKFSSPIQSQINSKLMKFFPYNI